RPRLPPFPYTTLFRSHVELLPWEAAAAPGAERLAAIYTYGHPLVDAALLDRLPAVRVVSNFGVGVDHIDVAAAAARGVPVGNTRSEEDTSELQSPCNL